MSFRILQGDARGVLSTLPAESVHCCVTSPPYWGLRDYGAEGQIGLEPTPDAYVALLVEVFREVRRVLRDDGTLWMNLGDAYCSGTSAARKATSTKGAAVPAGWAGRCQKERIAAVGDIKAKDLIGIPWLVAFALRADGWYLRSDIIWAKPNPMPESVTDRPTKAHEYLFLLSKSARYYYDEEAVKEPMAPESAARYGYAFGGAKSARLTAEEADGPGTRTHPIGERTPGTGRNRRTVWTVATAPFAEAHFATFPPALVEPCIKAGTSERGVCPECGAPWERVTETKRNGSSLANPEKLNRLATEGAITGGTSGRRLGPNVADEKSTVGWRPTCAHGAAPVPAMCLDPFNGAGTTGLVATRLQRNYVGIELNPEYVAMSERRIRGDAPLFHGVA